MTTKVLILRASTGTVVGHELTSPFAVTWAFPAHLIGMFLRDAHRRRFPGRDGGVLPVNPNLHLRFFQEAWQAEYLPAPTLPLPSTRVAPGRTRKPSTRRPHDRVAEAIGSAANEAPFSLLDTGLVYYLDCV